MILAQHFITQICARLGKTRRELIRKCRLFSSMIHGREKRLAGIEKYTEGIISTSDKLEISEQEIRHYIGDFATETQFSDHATLPSTVIANNAKSE